MTKKSISEQYAEIDRMFERLNQLKRESNSIKSWIQTMERKWELEDEQRDMENLIKETAREIGKLPSIFL